jgi:membrane protease YdiL (CAAX protease family)
MVGAWLDRALAQATPPAVDSPQVRRRVVLIIISAAVLLTLRQYIFTSQGIGDFLYCLDAFLLTRGIDFGYRVPQDDRLIDLACWTFGQIISYLLIPIALLKLVVREPLRDYGLKLKGALGSSWVYAAMFALMLPLILIMATTKEFQGTYPFYQPPRGESLWPRFVVWQLLYALQFVSLEFFFRGYLIHGLKQPLGAYAILISMVPYCMIHYGKPLPETLGSIVAGVVLGFMSYTTRSVWLGAALHIAVALTMDFSALWNEGWFGS